MKIVKQKDSRAFLMEEGEGEERREELIQPDQSEKDKVEYAWIFTPVASKVRV